jgi:ethanolamine utilization protein EutQ (cupin superfamily)
MSEILPIAGKAPVTREKVVRAEKLMLEHGVPVEIPVTHHFANRGTKRGAYGREICIPKDTLLTGHIHKHEQLNVMLEGDISVLMDDGTVKRIDRPGTVVVSPAGTKRIAYTHAETRWLTVHATENSDLKLIEGECIAKTEEEFQAFLTEQRLLERREAA